MVLYSDDALSDRICSLAAHIDAALCQWLELVAEFDRRVAWADSGARSCADWLAFTCSISSRTARDHVRVAGRLAAFPLATEAFRRGELSYSKVRAITRVGDVSREAELVELARAASAAQLDRIVRAHTRVIRTEQPDARRRFVSLDEDEDGTWILRGRLGAEEAAVVNGALAALRGSAEPQEDQETVATIGECNADALVAMAGGAGTAPEVTVLVDVEALASADEAPGRCELEGGAPMAAETARRLCCDAGIVVSTHRDGKVLDVGRRRRTVSPALSRALRTRDGCCQFPGCTNHRFVDAHHIKHWAHGRRHVARQSRPALPAPPPAGARGRLHARARARRRHRRAHADAPQDRCGSAEPPRRLRSGPAHESPPRARPAAEQPAPDGRRRVRPRPGGRGDAVVYAAPA
jgi:Domain of unknown function (DUF222)